jgi:hypothetical protein
MEVMINGKAYVEKVEEPRYKVGQRVYCKRYHVLGTYSPLEMFGEIKRISPTNTEGGHPAPYEVEFPDDVWWLGDADIDHERTAQGEPQEPEITEFAGKYWMLAVELDSIFWLVSEDKETWLPVARVDEDMEFSPSSATMTTVVSSLPDEEEEE